MLKKINVFFCFSFLFLNFLSAEMTEPYRSIKMLPFDPQGWFCNAEQIHKCMQEYKPTTVIEVGSWLGASTRFIAATLPSGGKLYAVDTWLGSQNEEVHMRDPRLPYLYQLFLSNVIHAGLTEVIVPIRMLSSEAAKALNIQADMIYIDASHDTESVFNDIMAWHPHLSNGPNKSLLCGDDWMWPTVQAAVFRAAEILKLRIVAEGNFWRFVP